MIYKKYRTLCQFVLFYHLWINKKEQYNPCKKKKELLNVYILMTLFFIFNSSWPTPVLSSRPTNPNLSVRLPLH